MWGDSFSLAKRNAGPLAAWTAALVVTATLADQYGYENQSIVPLSIAGVFAQTFIVVAALQVGLGDPARADIRPLFLRVFLIGLISGLAIVVGTLLLIVPGVLLLIRWWIAVPAALDRDLSPTDALRESWALTRPHWAGILGLLIGLIAIAGLAAGLGALLGGFGEEVQSLPMLFTTNLVTYGLTNFATVSSVAVYRAIRTDVTDLRAVFE